MSWHGDAKAPFEYLGMTNEKHKLMRELSETSDYWSSARRFVEGITGRKLSTLTLRQRNWLNEIISSLGERAE